jgi:hypothetical protein
MRSTWRIWPLLVLLAEVLAFFRQVLFYGHYAIPWDFRYYHFSQASFVAQSLARGELPLWDPYTYCGMPFYANLTAQVFYPPALAAVFLSNWTGGRHLLYFLELQMLAHVFLGGALTYWLLRRLGVTRAAAVTGATIYQLGAYMASQTQHLGAIDAAAWLPLAWLAVISLAGSFQWRWVAGLAFALAMSILAGFPASTAVVFVSCFLLAAFMAVLRRASWKLAAVVAASAVWAVLAAAIQVLPTLQLSRLSVAQYRSDFLRSGGGMPVESLVSLARPNYYGIFQFDGGSWKLPWDPTFLYTYCGIPALLFVVLGIAFRRNRYTVAFALLTFCAALWMLGDSTPVGRTMFLLLPDAVRAPLYAQFALCGFSLGMAVLAGLGADSFLWGRARWIQAGVVAVVAADLILAGSGRPMNTVDERADPGIGYDHYDRYPEIPAEIRRLVNQETPPWRIDLMDAPHDMASAAPVFGYPTANGDDPFALVRLMQVRLSFCRGERWGRFYEIAEPDSPVLKLLNVRYVISSRQIGCGRTREGTGVAGHGRLSESGCAAAVLPGEPDRASRRDGRGAGCTTVARVRSAIGSDRGTGYAARRKRGCRNGSRARIRGTRIHFARRYAGSSIPGHIGNVLPRLACLDRRSGCATRVNQCGFPRAPGAGRKPCCKNALQSRNPLACGVDHCGSLVGLSPRVLVWR